MLEAASKNEGVEIPKDKQLGLGRRLKPTAKGLASTGVERVLLAQAHLNTASHRHNLQIPLPAASAVTWP